MFIFRPLVFLPFEKVPFENQTSSHNCFFGATRRSSLLSCFPFSVWQQAKVWDECVPAVCSTAGCKFNAYPCKSELSRPTCPTSNSHPLPLYSVFISLSVFFLQWRWKLNRLSVCQHNDSCLKSHKSVDFCTPKTSLYLFNLKTYLLKKLCTVNEHQPSLFLRSGDPSSVDHSREYNDILETEWTFCFPQLLTEQNGL